LQSKPVSGRLLFFGIGSINGGKASGKQRTDGGYQQTNQTSG